MPLYQPASAHEAQMLRVQAHMPLPGHVQMASPPPARAPTKDAKAHTPRRPAAGTAGHAEDASSSSTDHDGSDTSSSTSGLSDDEGGVPSNAARVATAVPARPITQATAISAAAAADADADADADEPHRGPGLDPAQDAALAMLRMGRSLSETNISVAEDPDEASGTSNDDEDQMASKVKGEDGATEAKGKPRRNTMRRPRPPCRKSNSDSKLTQKLQSRCSSLEQEVLWLKSQVVGLNRTIEMLAGAVKTQLAVEPSKLLKVSSDDGEPRGQGAAAATADAGADGAAAAAEADQDTTAAPQRKSGLVALGFSPVLRQKKRLRTDEEQQSSS